MITTLQRSAVHEAAHAIVTHAVGGLVVHVDLHRSESSSGTSHGQCVTFAPRKVVARASIAYAGIVAEQMLDEGWQGPAAVCGDWYLRQPAHAPTPAPAVLKHRRDRRSDARYAAEMSASAQLRGFERARESLVRDWAAVIAMADRLIEDGEMSGEDAHALARRHGVAVFSDLDSSTRRRAPAGTAPAKLTQPRREPRLTREMTRRANAVLGRWIRAGAWC